MPQSNHAMMRVRSAAVMVVGKRGMFPLLIRDLELPVTPVGEVNSPPWWWQLAHFVAKKPCAKFAHVSPQAALPPPVPGAPPPVAGAQTPDVGKQFLPTVAPVELRTVTQLAPAGQVWPALQSVPQLPVAPEPRQKFVVLPH